MRQKDEAKAQEILRATLDEVQVVGLAGLSIEAVARRAGVATGTIYTYFRNKDALLDALYLHTKQKFATFVLRDDGLPLRAAFLQMARAYLDYIMENQAEMVFMGQMANSPYVTDETRASVALGVRPGVALLERGKAEQLLKPLDSHWMLAFLSGALGALVPLASAAPPARYAEFREAAALACWDALKA
jgi:AcrR family transcriptional regulator